MGNEVDYNDDVSLIWGDPAVQQMPRLDLPSEYGELFASTAFVDFLRSQQRMFFLYFNPDRITYHCIYSVFPRTLS